MKSKSTDAPETNLVHQFRMCRLQVLNWGTFSDLHDIQIAERGFLFTGRSGTGKSTLLDAIAALLIPPKWIEFNAAAREGDRSRKDDRNVLSYIRGAYAEQKDSDSGEIATRYMRADTTRSALSLSYKNGHDEWITLVQFLYVRGVTNDPTSVKRLHMIFKRNFDVRELSGFDIDARKIKHHFNNDAYITDEFRPYSERFRKVLGIENEMALRLLHKAQSAKNLPNLNLFLREFMLDPPDTFDAADRLVSEFSELDEAHQSVVTARCQIQTLTPAKEQFELRSRYEHEKKELEVLSGLLEPFTEHIRSRLLTQRINDLTVKLEQAEATRAQREMQRLECKSELNTLEQQHKDLGGDQIVNLEQDLEQAERSKTEKIGKLKQIQSACKALHWTEPDSPDALIAMVSRSRELLANWQSRGEAMQAELLHLEIKKNELRQKLDQCKRELDEMRRQPSNIPSKMLHLRKQVCLALKIHEDALPFVGELIEVRPEEASWRGAIERVLHGFAMSILVEDKYYNALTNHVNSTNLGERLVFYRTGVTYRRETHHSDINSLVAKITLKGNVHAPWLTAELRDRYDYTCVSSPQALRACERSAITAEGLIKSSKTRHEKDDRRGINDQRFWILGFDNKEKRQVFEKEERELSDQASGLDAQIREMNDQNRQLGSNALYWQTVANIEWHEIDVTIVIDKVNRIIEQLQRLRSKNSGLEKLGKDITIVKSKLSNFEKAISDLRSDETVCKRDRSRAEEDLKTLFEQWGLILVPGPQESELERRLNLLPDSATLANLDRLSSNIDRSIQTDITRFSEQISDCKQRIETAFGTFKRLWASESANMDETIASANDFLELLLRLENDNLPKYEDRFFELLQNQSHQNLAALNTHITQGRKTIHDRMELVNQSLNAAEFNPGSFLQIRTIDRQLGEVKEFRQEIHAALSHAWSTQDRDQAEQRFQTMRQLVKRLSSQEPSDRRWRTTVLDVREHVEFVGQEVDANGEEIETYRSGAGKSGGQRQKLATTCLAAALHYQLSRDEEGTPKYAAVVLDEAFDKADNEFTATAMNIFDKFGFQMIVATPLKSVMTLEPFIGGASFVDIRDRCHSSQLPLQYDTGRKRLKLSEDLRREVESATAIS